MDENFSALGIYKAVLAIASTIDTIVSLDLEFYARTFTNVSGISDWERPLRFLFPFWYKRYIGLISLPNIILSSNEAIP